MVIYVKNIVLHLTWWGEFTRRPVAIFVRVTSKFDHCQESNDRDCGSRVGEVRFQLRFCFLHQFFNIAWNRIVVIRGAICKSVCPVVERSSVILFTLLCKSFFPTRVLLTLTVGSLSSSLTCGAVIKVLEEIYDHLCSPLRSFRRFLLFFSTASVSSWWCLAVCLCLTFSTKMTEVPVRCSYWQSVSRSVG